MDYSEEKYKNILLGLLDKFILICKEHNLSYTLLGGSVLGAVRHGGIIPWDDDIDIGMPRADYEKFISFANNFLEKDYKVATIYNDNNYMYPFAKLYDNNTTIIESKDFFYIGGVYIDIFPLDGIPQQNGNTRFTIIRKLRYSITNPLFIKYSISYEEKKSFYYFANKIIYKTSNLILKICNKMASKYPCTKDYNIVNYFGAWREKEISDYSWFFPLKEFSFDGRKVLGPNNYDAYLKKMYGDYMTPPPIEKRKSHHLHYFIDLSRRYTLEEIHKRDIE